METKCVFKFVAGALFVATGTASTLALAEELDTGSGVSTPKEKPVGLAQETDQAWQVFIPSRLFAVGLAEEVDVAFAVAAAKILCYVVARTMMEDSFVDSWGLLADTEPVNAVGELLDEPVDAAGSLSRCH